MHAGASIIAFRQGVESLVTAKIGGGVRIAIGVLPTVATAVVPRAVKRTKDEGLAATVYLATGANDVLLKLLKDRQLDLVVGRFADVDLMPDLAFEYLYSEEIVLVGRNQRVTLRAITRYTVFLPEPGSIIIRPIIDTLLISRGVAQIADVIA